MIDCHTRKLLGWHLLRSGKACTAGCALALALNARFGTLGRVLAPFGNPPETLLSDCALKRTASQLNLSLGLRLIRDVFCSTG